jgi:hypothetical protein
MLSRVSCSLLHLHPSDNSRLDNLISWFAASILVTAPNSRGIRLNEHVEADGPTARLQNGPGGPCVEAARLVLSQRPIPRLAQNEKPECAGSEAGGGGGLGAMSGTDDLSQAERLIAECKNRIARQREVIANAFQKGHDTEVPVSMLRALEASLRAFETHRQLILDRKKRR